jgi:hypothetical protein
MTAALAIAGYLTLGALFFLWWARGRGPRENSSRIIRPLMERDAQDDWRLSDVARGSELLHREDYRR